MAGKKSRPTTVEHHASQSEHQGGDHRDDEPPLEQHREHAHVATAKPLEAALEGLLKARKPIARAICPAVVLSLEQHTDDDRRQRPDSM